jgi:hypothetical protein
VIEEHAVNATPEASTTRSSSGGGQSRQWVDPLLQEEGSLGRQRVLVKVSSKQDRDGAKPRRNPDGSAHQGHAIGNSRHILANRRV